MRILWSFLWRDIQNEVSYSLSFVLQLFSIFPIVFLFFYLSQLFGNTVPTLLQAYGGRYFPFVLVGIALQNYFSMGLSSFSGNIREAQLSGTLEAMLAAPVPLPVFLLGSILYPFAFNALRVLLYLAAGSLISDGGLCWNRLPSACVVLLLGMAAFSSMGLLSAAFIILFKKGDPLNWIFSVSAWLLGGVYYPVEVLPGWLQETAQWIPMTHALEALRHILLTGESLSSAGPHLAKLGLWAVIGLPAGYLFFRFAVDRARVNGSLGHY